MIQKKICMLGAFAVGKTSLVRRFVESMFSEKYHTTVGVKIDRKRVQIDDHEVNLVVWDIHGEDELQKIRLSYLRGASGYFLIADGTRRPTLETARALQNTVQAELGGVPFLLVLNKVDLRTDWEIEDSVLEEYTKLGWQIVTTSAKTGAGVEDAFLALARNMLAD
jgi:small GTP-binding protein